MIFFESARPSPVPFFFFYKKGEYLLYLILGIPLPCPLWRLLPAFYLSVLYHILADGFVAMLSSPLHCLNAILDDIEKNLKQLTPVPITLGGLDRTASGGLY